MVGLLRLIDQYLFGGLSLLFFWIKYVGKKHRKHPKRILVIRLWTLGSSLLTLPMIEQLKNYYGDQVQIDGLVTSRSRFVYQQLGCFDEIYDLFSVKGVRSVLKKFKSYDVVIDTEDYFRLSSLVSLRVGKTTIGFGELFTRRIAYTNPVAYNDQQHMVLAFLDLLKPLGIPTTVPETLVSLPTSEQDKSHVGDFLSTYTSYQYKVCLHTGGAETAPWRFRKQENRVILIKELLKTYDSLVIFLSGTSHEAEGIQEIISHLDPDEQDHVIDCTSAFSLPQFAAFLAECDLCVSNDTGPMHLSAAMGITTIGLFGPNLPLRFAPYPASKHISLYKGDNNPSIQVHLGKFTKPKIRWIDEISVEDVVCEVKKALAM